MGGLILRGDSVNALNVLADGRAIVYIARLCDDKLVLEFEDNNISTVQVDFAKDKFYIVNLYNKSKVPAVPFTLTATH